MLEVTTWKDLEAYASEVTTAEVAKCQRQPGPDGQIFWAVENEAGHAFEGETLKYQVRYSASEGFTCTCKAFLYRRLAHITRTCKHCHWVVAAALAERAAAAQATPAATTAEPEAAAPEAPKALKPTPVQKPLDPEEARKQSEADRERRMKAPLNGNGGFQLLR